MGRGVASAVMHLKPETGAWKIVPNTGQLLYQHGQNTPRHAQSHGDRDHPPNRFLQRQIPLLLAVLTGAFAQLLFGESVLVS